MAGLVLVDVVPDVEPHRVRRFLAAGGMLDAHREFVDDVLAQIPLLRQITADLDLPILLVRGGTSPVTDDDVEKLLHLAPHATVAHIPDAGHLVARDQPAALAESIASVTSTWPALALLRDLGAEQVDHPGGNLLDHVKRVHELLANWGADKRVLLAALCHATYGTDGFQHALLPPDQRARLRTAIGDEAEALVYLYGACDRNKTYARLGTTPLQLTDRFTGDVIALTAADRADFALLTVANELDVARTAPLTTETRYGIRALIAALAAYLPHTAAQEALTDPSLSPNPAD
nr:hypothetical protein [Kibdelosporangium sp. MJ126-NF4]